MIKNATNILGTLNGEKNYLIVLEPENFQQDVDSLIDFVVKKRNWSCVYLSLNKSYESLKSRLEKQKYNLKKFFFIETVGSSLKEKIPNVTLIPSSSALTEIDITINQLAQFVQSQGVILVDTLEGLLINNDPKVLANFVKSLVKKSSQYNSKLIVLSSGGGEEKFINILAPFFDKVVRIQPSVQQIKK